MMNKNILYIVLFFLLTFFAVSNPADAQQSQDTENKTEQNEQLVIYNDNDSPDNHFYPTERIGDGQALEFDDNWQHNPQSGNSCIKVRYNATGSFGWAGIYWVNPKGNWGDEKGGFDLRFAKKLTFWVRGEKGGEHIAVFRFGGLKGVYPDSDNHGIGPVVLTDKWQQLSIDVSQRNMRYISAGFSFALTKAHNRKGCIFYIDNIKYE